LGRAPSLREMGATMYRAIAVVLLLVFAFPGGMLTVEFYLATGCQFAWLPVERCQVFAGNAQIVNPKAYARRPYY
jgi:hypothetical protein